jgi:hypothetical protein
MQFFSYSPDNGFDFHSTKESAVKEASAALAIEKDGSGDGWSEEVCEICWGVICERATKTNERPAEPGSDFDYLCEYELEPDPDLREILNDLLAEKGS